MITGVVFMNLDRKFARIYKKLDFSQKGEGIEFVADINEATVFTNRVNLLRDYPCLKGCYRLSAASQTVVTLLKPSEGAAE